MLCFHKSFDTTLVIGMSDTSYVPIKRIFIFLYKTPQFSYSHVLCLALVSPIIFNFNLLSIHFLENLQYRNSYPNYELIKFFPKLIIETLFFRANKIPPHLYRHGGISILFNLLQKFLQAIRPGRQPGPILQYIFIKDPARLHDTSNIKCILECLLKEFFPFSI